MDQQVTVIKKLENNQKKINDNFEKKKKIKIVTDLLTQRLAKLSKEKYNFDEKIVKMPVIPPQV